MKIPCKNIYCIHQKNGECLLESIAITLKGECDRLRMLEMEESELEPMKRLWRETY